MRRLLIPALKVAEASPGRGMWLHVGAFDLIDALPANTDKTSQLFLRQANGAHAAQTAEARSDLDHFKRSLIPFRSVQRTMNRKGIDGS